MKLGVKIAWDTRVVRVWLQKGYAGLGHEGSTCVAIERLCLGHEGSTCVAIERLCLGHEGSMCVAIERDTRVVRVWL